MAIKWIVLVTRTEARVFTEKTFRLIAELRNDLGREKNRAMTTSKPGLARLSREKNPHEDAAVSFAKRVKTFLTKEAGLGHFDRLLVVSEPKMAGRLRAQMNRRLQANTEWLNKDLAKASVSELPKLIKASGS